MEEKKSVAPSFKKNINSSIANCKLISKFDKRGTIYDVQIKRGLGLEICPMLANSTVLKQ